MSTDRNNYIERNPLKCFNMPSLIGRRLTVYDTVSSFLYLRDVKMLMDDFEINISQLQAAIKYCNNVECTIDYEEHQFCDGCRLRELHDKKLDIYEEIKNQNNIEFNLHPLTTDVNEDDESGVVMRKYAKLLDVFFQECV